MGRLPRRPNKEYVIKSKNVQSTTSPFRRKEYRITGEPVKEINEAIGRLRVNLERQEKLEEQLEK